MGAITSAAGQWKHVADVASPLVAARPRHPPMPAQRCAERKPGAFRDARSRSLLDSRAANAFFQRSEVSKHPLSAKRTFVVPSRSSQRVRTRALPVSSTLAKAEHSFPPSPPTTIPMPTTVSIDHPASSSNNRHALENSVDALSPIPQSSPSTGTSTSCREILPFLVSFRGPTRFPCSGGQDISPQIWGGHDASTASSALCPSLDVSRSRLRTTNGLISLRLETMRPSPM